jgi:hypothetical protein
MPRLRRLPFIPFGWYYVMMRAVRSRRLVSDAADLNLLLEQLRHGIRKSGAHLHAGSVTACQVHIILQSGERPVQDITRSFCHRYARLFNQRHAQTGSLFQSHPRLLLIQHQTWLVRAAHVIHWIPRRCWSTDAAYRHRGRHEGIITHAMLHLLTHGSRSRDLQQTAYRERFDQPPSPYDINLLERGSPEDSRILGDTVFICDAWRVTRQRLPRRQRNVQFADEAIQHALSETLERFVAMCDEKLPQRRAFAWKNIATPERLRSHSRKYPLPLIRAMVASYSIGRALATQAQVAQFFGCHPKTLSAQRRRDFETRLNKLLERPINGR